MHDGRQFEPSAPITSENNNEFPPLSPPFGIFFVMGHRTKQEIPKVREGNVAKQRGKKKYYAGLKRKREGSLERRERERKRKNPTRVICIHGQPAARCELVLSTRG